MRKQITIQQSVIINNFSTHDLQLMIHNFEENPFRFSFMLNFAVNPTIIRFAPFYPCAWGRHRHVSVSLFFFCFSIRRQRDDVSRTPAQVARVSGEYERFAHRPILSYGKWATVRWINMRLLPSSIVLGAIREHAHANDNARLRLRARRSSAGGFLRRIPDFSRDFRQSVCDSKHLLYKVLRRFFPPIPIFKSV